MGGGYGGEFGGGGYGGEGYGGRGGYGGGSRRGVRRRDSYRPGRAVQDDPLLRLRPCSPDASTSYRLINLSSATRQLTASSDRTALAREVIERPAKLLSEANAKLVTARPNGASRREVVSDPDGGRRVRRQREGRRALARPNSEGNRRRCWFKPTNSTKSRRAIKGGGPRRPSRSGKRDEPHRPTPRSCSARTDGGSSSTTTSSSTPGFTLVRLPAAAASSAGRPPTEPVSAAADGRHRQALCSRTTQLEDAAKPSKRHKKPPTPSPIKPAASEGATAAKSATAVDTVERAATAAADTVEKAATAADTVGMVAVTAARAASRCGRCAAVAATSRPPER